MKNWIPKIKGAICSNKGESLVESVVSLIVLSILLVGLTTMIQASLRMTSTSFQNAKEMQDNINNIILSTSVGNHGKIIFKNVDGDILAEHEVSIINTNGIIAFEPEKVGVSESEEEAAP